ncbi:hypothetical protein NBH19_11445 [Rhizobium sp. S95]|uniref:Uncharacterized protein n=1 Tax=Ciceribacter sichuanensis TaxID=2949647 RepID=A0AAJ1C0Y1_9HYPH|nr:MULTISPECIES: hypothetical protein [unclassified Ciceribacter]MCM2396689.1 hypothetical protein [Ciceribacter sp. S95]MCO5959818.1 hypothetical protein [Ciceribacter sp. S101]
MHNESIVALNLSGSTLSRLEQKACSTEAMLRQRLSGNGGSTEVDLILCHYLYGLVAAAMSEASPTLLLGMLRHLGSLVLSNDAITSALFAQPPGQETDLGRMIRLAEQAGRREGGNIRSAECTTAHDLIEPGTSRHADLQPAKQKVRTRP